MCSYSAWFAFGCIWCNVGLLLVDCGLMLAGRVAFEWSLSGLGWHVVVSMAMLFRPG
jgi:hypothetical protein